MNKAWPQSAIYFLNVFFHCGIILVLFTVAISDNLTLQEQIIDFWNYPEGKEIIYINSAFIFGNLIFASMVLFNIKKSLSVSITFSILAWFLVLTIFIINYYGLIFSYILGAVLLTYLSYSKMQMNKTLGAKTE